MTAYELEINALRERIASLEAAYGPFGTHNETHNHVNKRLEKLEAADKDRGERQLYWEKHLSVELRNMNDLINESKLLPLFSHREQLGELKTRVEALETRLEATLSTLKGNGIRGDNPPLYTDRAHGPLEVTTRADDINDHFDDVEALVKAAIGMQCAAAEMLRAPHEESSRDWLSAASDALRRCVKPFEAAK